MHAITFAAAPAGDLLSDASDAQLWNLQILHDLACRRDKLAQRQTHRDYLCFAARIVLPEFARRGITPPPSTAGVNDLRKA